MQNEDRQFAKDGASLFFSSSFPNRSFGQGPQDEKCLLPSADGTALFRFPFSKVLCGGVGIFVFSKVRGMCGKDFRSFVFCG
jgi:hypothetical protein